MPHRVARTMPKGFTLIELLVVITIIVVLLALLTPALDKAIYRAELAVCGSNFHSMGRGVLVYAAEHKRQYPYLPGPRTANGWAAHKFNEVNRATNQPTNDTRLVIENHISMGVFKDPLAPAELDWGRSATRPDSQVFIAYDLLFSFQFRHELGGAGMFKIGDRLAWDGKRYNLLAQDKEAVAYGGTTVNDNIHPDDAGVLTEVVRDNTNTASVFGDIGAIRQVRSYWIVSGTYDRGNVDRNFLYSDGSVSLLDQTEKVETKDERELDERIDLIPMVTGGPETGPPPDSWMPTAAR